MRTKRTRSHVLVAAVVSLLLASAWPTLAGATHQWNNFHWTREANPLVLGVGDNLDSTWSDYLTTAVSDWSQHPELVVITIDKGSSASPECVPVTGTVQACNGEYGPIGWLGLASVWNASGHIAMGILQLNDTYFNQPAYDTPEWRNLVMCQELAHTFGLGHQDEGHTNPNLGSCMDYSDNPAGPPTNEHPNQHDWDQLNEIYEHVDTAQAFAAVAAQTTALNAVNVPAAQIAFPEVGGTAEFAATGAGGISVNTFVILADEEVLERGAATAATPVSTPES